MRRRTVLRRMVRSACMLGLMAISMAGGYAIAHSAMWATVTEGLASSTTAATIAVAAVPVLASTAADAVALPAAPLEAPATEPWDRRCQMNGWGSVDADGRLVHGRTFYSVHWGNVLSPYWQARGMARLGGFAFTLDNTMGAWLAHLPRAVPATEPLVGRPKQWDIACRNCSEHQWWEFAHKCYGGWTEIGPEIVRDTRAALAAWATENKRELPAYLPDDVVIQDRCNGDTFFDHPEYGPPAFSFYTAMAPTTKRVFIVSDPTAAELIPVCKLRRDALAAFIRAKYPAAAVEPQAGSRDAFLDFAKLVYAPVLFKDMSSFGVWAAMANDGVVHATRMFPSATFPNPHWRWSTAPVLLPPLAKELGFSKENAEAAMAWLAAN